MVRFIFALFICLLFSSQSAQAQYKRLDPHGAADINLYKQNSNLDNGCLICHFQKKVGKSFKLKLVPDVEQSCFACHNKMPHSGLVEHFGKDLAKLKIGLTGKVTCLSCHRPHRSTLKKGDLKSKITAKKSRSFIFRKDRKNKLKSGFVQAANRTLMMRKDCIDCHTAEKLP